MLTDEDVKGTRGGRDDHPEDDESCADYSDPPSTHQIRQRFHEPANSGKVKQIGKYLDGVSDDSKSQEAQPSRHTN